MELSAGYKNTEVGVIPKDWKVKTIGEISKLKNGYAFSSDFFCESGPIVITPGNFKLEGGLHFNNRNTLRYCGYVSKEMQFQNGDLLIVMTDLTPDCNLLGKPGIVSSEEVILHNQRIGKITITSNLVNKEFLYWFFVSELFSKRMKETATGSTVRHTSVGSINNSFFAIPPLSEQTAIASALSDTDALIGSLEKLIAKKRNIKQGAMQKLLQPKEGWEVKKLGEVLKVKHGKDQKEFQSENGNYPILGTGGLMAFSSKFLYDKPSVLIGRKGTIDKPQFMQTPFWTVDTLFYTEIFKGYDAKFIYYIFNLIDWYSYNEASGVPSLNAKTIEKIEKGFPSFEEQTRIATILSDMDNEITGLEAKLEKYRKVKLGMMQNLLTGKIRLL